MGAGTHPRKLYKNIYKQTLDEDSDVTGDPQIMHSDELFVRVSVQPFVAEGAQKDSATVSGQFG